MGFRITTGMMMNSYKYNLSKSTAQMDSARNKVLSERKYDSYAEDPASAAHEWRIRRAITRNAGYITSNSEAYSRINTAWATLATIDDNLLNGDGGAFASIKRADNDPTAGARTALGKVLDNLAQSIIYSLNGAKYGDHFIFSGNDEMNAPFSWDGDKLLYRGIPVDSGWAKNVASDKVVPDWAKNTKDQKNLIPVNTPQMSELDKDALGDLEYSRQLAWVAYYRDGYGPSDNPEVTPDWVTEYQSALNAALADGKTADDVDIDDYYLGSGMSALDQAWKTYLNANAEDISAAFNPVDDPDDAEDPDNPDDPDNPAATKTIDDIFDSISETIADKPDWGAEILPKNIPAINEDSTNWDKAWITYYQMMEDDYNPDNPYGNQLQPPYEMVNPSWDIDDPSTWPSYSKGNEYEDYVQNAWLDYAYDRQNLKLLDAMSAEVKNMDLGMGLKEDSKGDLLQSTVFDRAVPGINVIGYGVDEDGDPKNIVSIMKRLAQLYSKCDTEDGQFYKVDPDTGEYVLNSQGERIVDEETTNEVYRLLDKFNAAHDEFNHAYSDVDTKGEYLQSNAERLVSQSVTLQEQLYDVAELDPALAIEEFSYTYYCYSAALKIGTQLLSQSLIDYMR